MSGKILLSKTQKHQDENREILQKTKKTVGGNRRKQGAVANEDLPVLLSHVPTETTPAETHTCRIQLLLRPLDLIPKQSIMSEHAE
jgi:hypothetical protein